MRVIAGTARSIPLVTPMGDELTRPTQDRIKETLFNIIQMEVPGSVFLDLCAGSGAIGIEAISRGARRCYFVENAKEAVSCIQQNLHKTHFEESAVILKQDVLNAIRNIHEKHADVIYLDPPYNSEVMGRSLELLAQQSYVDEYTVIIAEDALEADYSYVSELGLVLDREKRYKTQKHVFMHKEVEE